MTKVEELVRAASEHYLAGRFDQAISVQQEAIQADETGTPAQLHIDLGLFQYGIGKHKDAVESFGRATEIEPENLTALTNLGLTQIMAGLLKQAVATLEHVSSLRPDDANVRDGLCTAYGHLGNMAKVRKHGNLALELKDYQILEKGIVHEMSSIPLPAFDDSDPSRNIISFSLFGDGADYLSGARHNLEVAGRIYPGWRCRFHCDDTVPESARADLAELGGEIVLMPTHKTHFDGLFWRFLVIDDPKVTRYLIRDADSVISVKERVAVDAWLASDKYFHIMRDWYTHTEVIMAGMWGGVQGALPKFSVLIKEFSTMACLPDRTVDQLFLRTCVWPTARRSCLIHDRYFSALGALPFPPYGDLPDGRHIGENEAKIR